MARYSDADKAIAIEIIIQNDGEVSASLDDIRVALDAPTLNKTTVYRWWNDRDNNEAVANTQHIKKDGVDKRQKPTKEWVQTTLAEIWQNIATTYSTRALDDDVINNIKGLDAVKGAAIATDKLIKLLDIPDEVIVILPVLVDVIKGTGRNPAVVLNQLKEKLLSEQNSLYEH